jgi:hypothetical protein
VVLKTTNIMGTLFMTNRQRFDNAERMLLNVRDSAVRHIFTRRQVKANVVERVSQIAWRRNLKLPAKII